MAWRRGLQALLLIGVSSAVRAGGVPGEAVQLERVEVSATRTVTQPDSASIGTVYAEQFQNRPLSRPGELLEVVPGLIVTQHSGEGKANQYFLRGFNLDHGTDFATIVDGMPVNMPTHAHGQGYTDVNFMIPELVDAIEYRKGPYYAQYGDFSSAGAVDVRYRSRFDRQQIAVTGGGYGYGRAVLTGSAHLLDGDLLYGVEGLHYDGPWTLNDDFNKGSGVLRYTRRHDDSEFHVAAMAYDARWNATDQIPQRAVDQGLIGRLGCLDCSDGGNTWRYSLSAGFDRALGNARWTGSAYALRYHLDLYSDFTYFLNDPVNGDQFEQADTRDVYGGQTALTFNARLLGLPMRNELGLQTRFDAIAPVGLYDTQARARLSTVSESRVHQWSQSAYAQTSLRPMPWLSTTAGLRFDQYDFRVASTLPANAGDARDHVVSPKLTVVIGPFEQTEFFINLGKGFHSNDARGTTETVSPKDGSAVLPVTPLVATRGADLGLRSALIPNLQATLSVFALRIDSELTFSGDAGDTEANRPSARYGTELSLYWEPLSHLVIDSDLAWTHSRFSDHAPQGDHIPEAATSVAAVGLAYELGSGWFGALRLRYFGPRPLIEDASLHSQATTLVNLDLGYRLTPHLKLAGQVLNLLNSHDHDIDYAFASRLPGEPATGVQDIHFHPVEPINARLLLSYDY
ncbi:MAG: TonB-dependent receptor [Nevskiaceae bacterium]|nr:MAG: TonB-dependent receptor [Nevskiaceae bacterium]